MDNASIAWALPSYGPIWAPAYVSHLQAIAYASRSLEVLQLGQISAVSCTDRMALPVAQNAAVTCFLATEATHLFFTETDMLLPKETLPLLLSLRKPIVSGIYFERSGSGQPCLYARAPGDDAYAHVGIRLFPRDTPFQVDCCGMGCVLIARQVFERLRQPWFATDGSDVYFYTHARQAGIPVWAHPGVLCGQIDYTVVDYQDYATRLRTDPTWAGHGFILT